MVHVLPMETPVRTREAVGHCLKGFVARCKSLPALSIAVCHPCSEVALAGAIEAAQHLGAKPILVGPRAQIERIAADHQLDIGGLPIEDTADDLQSAQRSVALCREGKAQALMKGSLHTDTMMHEVVDHQSGLRRGSRRLSHVFVMDAPAYPRALLITDAAVNIAPTLVEKVDIVQNAIELAHALDIAQPRVAILSAAETVNPQIPSTLDAAALCKMADRGQITGGILDGPLAFDTAVSPEASAIKQLKSRVAGQADIVVAPDLESGNMLAKQLEYLGGATPAGVVLGARVPIILTSRADHAQARLASCAVAVIYAHALAQAPQAGVPHA